MGGMSLSRACTALFFAFVANSFAGDVRESAIPEDARFNVMVEYETPDLVRKNVRLAMEAEYREKLARCTDEREKPVLQNALVQILSLKAKKAQMKNEFINKPRPVTGWRRSISISPLGNLHC